VAVTVLAFGACGSRTEVDLPLPGASPLRPDAADEAYEPPPDAGEASLDGSEDTTDGSRDTGLDALDSYVADEPDAPFVPDSTSVDVVVPPDSGPPCDSVLLLDTESAAPRGLVAALQAASPGSFCTIDYYDANLGTPALSFLQRYQSILAFNENVQPYVDPVGLGDVLAAYFDGGGRVVIALFADGGYYIQGAFGSRYLLVAPIYVPEATDSYSSAIPTQDLVPTSPVLVGVHSISGAGWHGSQGIQNGGVRVAQWASGELLAVTGVVTDSSGHLRNRVDLNIQPSDVASGTWTGDGFTLLANAILYQ
jgi:hypothetical protein